MTVIGITGPSGAGKTTVLKVLEGLGVYIIDCDAVYHRLLREDGALLAALRARFGGEVFDQTGALDRKALGSVVFRDSQALSELNAITHARVLAEVERRLAEAEAGGRRAAAVDAIALIESGLAERCGVTVAVIAPAEVRAARLMAREGISEEYARKRIAAQRPDAFFEENCGYVLRNDGSAEDCRLRAQALFDKILNHPKEEK